MTLPNSTSKGGPTAGDGVTVNFTVPFYFLDQTHVLVTRGNADGTETILQLTTDYTVSGAGNPAGGSITLTSASLAPVGSTITRTRNVPLTQGVSLPETGPTPSKSLEAELDKLTMIAQQITEGLSRALRLAVSSTAALPILATPIANYALAYNSDASQIIPISPVPYVLSDGTLSQPGLRFDADPNTGLYRPATDTVGVVAGGCPSARFTAAASADNYLLVQSYATTVYGSSSHGGAKIAVDGAALSARMDFMTKYDNAHNQGSAGFAFYAGPNRLIMRLEPSGVNYTGGTDRHVHIEPGYSGTGQFPSIRSMANDGYIGPGGSGTNNNVTTQDINFGILSCGRGYIGLHTRGGNIDTAVGGGAGTGGGTDVLQAMVADTPAANGFFEMRGGTASANVRIGASSGYNGNQGLTLFTQNAGTFLFVTDGKCYGDSGGTDLAQFAIGHVASAVNYWRFQGATAGNQVYAQPDGASTDIGVIWGTKNAGSWFFQSGNGTLPQFVILHQASSANYLYVQGAATGSGPTLGCYPVGDTNQDINIAPRGTGKVNAPGFNVTASNIPANGLYLPAANTAGISARSLLAASFTMPASGVNSFVFTGTTTGNAPSLGVTGDVNLDLTLAPNGTGKVNAPALNVTGSNAPSNGLYLSAANTPTISANGAKVFQATLTGSGGNYPAVAAAGVGGISTIGTNGADSTGILGIVNVGSNSIIFYTAFSQAAGYIIHQASAVNLWYLKANSTGNGIELGAYPTGDSNIDVVLVPRGTGLLKFGNSGCFAANGSVATAITSVGPTGASTTVQEWLKIKNSSGTTRYIPCF